MRRILIFMFLIFLVTIVYAQTLDSAIEDAANEISGRLPERTTVVVISFQSDSSRLTDYVIDEINGKIANIGRIRPVERRQLNTIRSELNFNMSGEVSDESAQGVGRMLGAQYIIMGSIDLIANQYRIRFRAITVETASIEYSFSQNIGNDAVLESLLRGSGTGTAYAQNTPNNYFQLGVSLMVVAPSWVGGGINFGGNSFFDNSFGIGYYANLIYAGAYGYSAIIIDALVGATFRLIHTENFSLPVTLGLNADFSLIFGIGTGFNIGIGANITAEYKFNEKLRLYGRFQLAYGFLGGGELVITPSIGIVL